MKYLLITILTTLVLSIFAILVTNVVFANHRIYLHEDIRYAVSSIQGYENVIMYDWAINNSDVKWYAPPELRADVKAAINEWDKYFSQLGWTESLIKTGTENVIFEYRNCGPPGFFLPIDWQIVGDANYLKEVKICINSEEVF